MLVYRFKPQDRTMHKVALTREASGANLPDDGAPWEALGSIDLSTTRPWVNAPVDEIEKAVGGSQGYFVWSVAVPPMPRRFRV